MRHSVLIAIANDQFRCELYHYFSSQGFFVAEAVTVVQVRSRISCYGPDIIILDADVSPNLLSVCQSVRELSGKPIIVLTDAIDDETKIKGYEIGVDCILVGPVQKRELLARVNTQLRLERFQHRKSGNHPIHMSGVEIDPAKLTVSTPVRSLKLSPKEMEVLIRLAAEPGKVFSREYLLSTIWEYRDVSDTRTLDTHIKNLRSKFHALGSTCWSIKTVSKIGFKVCVSPASG
jgi:DNA-binding response OmpR family regulator